MQDQIEKIKFYLENCESIAIEGKHIGHLNIDNITYSISRMACNAIEEMYTAHHFAISINRDANVNQDMIMLGHKIDNRTLKPFSRLVQYPDITSIFIHFKGINEPKQFFVTWDSEDDQNNNNQKAYVNSFGDLFIVIDKELSLEDIFPKEQIEDQDSMDFEWSMFE